MHRLFRFRLQFTAKWKNNEIKLNSIELNFSFMFEWPTGACMNGPISFSCGTKKLIFFFFSILFWWSSISEFSMEYLTKPLIFVQINFDFGLCYSIWQPINAFIWNWLKLFWHVHNWKKNRFFLAALAILSFFPKKKSNEFYHLTCCYFMCVREKAWCQANEHIFLTLVRHMQSNDIFVLSIRFSSWTASVQYGENIN